MDEVCVCVEGASAQGERLNSYDNELGDCFSKHNKQVFIQ